jgi:hypothetical protein
MFPPIRPRPIIAIFIPSSQLEVVALHKSGEAREFRSLPR